MEPALKQRLIGAIVLVALAVIFLPMLIQGPAPESGAADVSLDLPPVPGGEYETRELPLVGAAPDGGVVGMDARSPRPGEALPTVDTADAAAPADDGSPGNSDDGADDDGMFPPSTAAGDYAVAFGSFSTTADADKLVGDLRASQLPGYREQARVNGWNVYRVRIGPYANRAEAEAARLRAAHVRDDVGARVVALNADAAAALKAAEEAERTAAAAPAKPETKPVASAPAPPPAPVAAAPVPAPATAGTGFAVQLGAFREAADADALRDRVRGGGFSVFTEQVDTDQGRLTRVLVGPVLDRAAANQLQAQVRAKFQIDGLVRSHP